MNLEHHRRGNIRKLIKRWKLHETQEFHEKKFDYNYALVESTLKSEKAWFFTEIPTEQAVIIEKVIAELKQNLAKRKEEKQIKNAPQKQQVRAVGKEKSTL